MNNINQSFNEDFCTYLEYHLGKVFRLSDRDDLKGFWCDGISPIPVPDSQLLKERVNDTGKIVTKAWIGKNGQDEYEMTIIFCKQSLDKYTKGYDLTGCIPSEENHDWYEIDTMNRTIKIFLK
ncbi:MAG: hypothetical protein PHR06_03880 [Candidatus Cloacimonetes bacterium]|nr:hypothetical protein [Candidatus Cloacimonadota bacterium]